MNADQLEDLFTIVKPTVKEIWESGKDAKSYCHPCRGNEAVFKNYEDLFRCRRCNSAVEDERKVNQIIENKTESHIEEMTIGDFYKKFNLIENVKTFCIKCNLSENLAYSNTRFICGYCKKALTGNEPTHTIERAV